MDLGNPSLWQLVYLQSFTAEYFDFLQLPIATFDTPSLTPSVIMLKITSAESKPTWNKAGNVAQIINAGNVQSSIKNHALYLNQDRVLILEPFSPYVLRFGLPKWFSQATISIFGFTG